MVQIIVTYIKTKEEKYYQEQNGIMESVVELSETDGAYHWWFYNEVAEVKFLDGYIYDEIEGIPAENINRIHENVYLKQAL